MKAIRKWFSNIPLFLVTVILFQGCAVYDIKNPVTLDQASEEKKKAKIKTNTNQTSIYNYISFENGQFYGVETKSGKLVRVPLNKNDITEVLVQNKSASTWATIAVIAVPVIAMTIFALTYDPAVSYDGLFGKAY
jgi:hypothetical protein